MFSDISIKEPKKTKVNRLYTRFAASHPRLAFFLEGPHRYGQQFHQGKAGVLLFIFGCSVCLDLKNLPVAMALKNC